MAVMIEPERCPPSNPIIRPVAPADWPALVHILREAVAAQDAFTYDAILTDAQIRELWGGASAVVVAEAPDGSVAGTAKMGRNQGGPGDHVATASFLVTRAWRRHGLGGQLCRYALDWAADAGFRAMQFNAVAASNDAAVKLWQSEGFRIVGVVPEGFRHPRKGFVDLLVMHQKIPRVE